LTCPQFDCFSLLWRQFSAVFCSGIPPPPLVYVVVVENTSHNEKYITIPGKAKPGAILQNPKASGEKISRGTIVRT